MANVTESLILWLQTFEVDAPCKTVHELSNGVAMAQALCKIAPDYFNSTWLFKIKSDTGTNWRLKVSNLKKILKGILDYYNEELCQQITGFHMPDVNAIGEHADKVELGRLLQLILGCAVNCSQKQEHIESIMGMEEAVQHVVMNCIQELMYKETPTANPGDSIAEMSERLKKYEDEVPALMEEKDQITQRCHELDMQVAVLQDEKSNLQLEVEKLMDRLNNVESMEDPSTVSGRRFQQMQQKVDSIQAEMDKLDTSREEYKMKVDMQERDILELQQKNEELTKKIEGYKNLKDELDVLRHVSDKVGQYESSIETYKKKLEDMADLKRQVKLLEDKNTTYMQQNMDLEEEVKRGHSFRSQIEIYKKQVQELHTKVSEQTRRADKSEFEMKRATEKLSALQQEKERLVAERDTLKESIEEMRCIQFQKAETAGLNREGAGQPTSPLSYSDVLEAVPAEIKEKLIRLQHENKMLKLKHSGAENEQAAILQSMLDDSKARQNELETENRLANQRILELESHLQDLQENQSSANSQEGSQLKQQLTNTMRRQKELEVELQKKKVTIESLESQVEVAVSRAQQANEQLAKREQDMFEMEERYKKYIEKAKSVIKGLDIKQNESSSSDVSTLKSQLMEKDKLIANLQKDKEKALALHEMETRLITSAYYNLGITVQKKSADERLQHSGGGQTFLSRQRQATSRRMNLPTVSPSEFFE